MYYYWTHYTKEQVIGDNIWRRAVADHFGLGMVLDESNGTFIIGDDVYIIGFNFDDEDMTINGKVYEDENEIADDYCELNSQLSLEMLKPYIKEGKDNPYCSFDLSKHNLDIDEIASDVVAENDLVYSMNKLADADIHPLMCSISWYNNED